MQMEELGILCCATALFLLAINLMGSGVHKAAGERLERLLERLTHGRLQGFLLGTVVTAAVQSSSAVTVLTAELTDSGLLPLRRAIPVLIGANVGTTATAWLVWLLGGKEWWAAEEVSLALLAAGAAVYLFTGKSGLSRIAWGLGLLLMAMELITAAALPLSGSAVVTRWLQICRWPLPSFLTGAVLTALVQSSSVSVGLLQAMSLGGGVSYAVAIPMILGQNIGTCITVFLAAAGGRKRPGQVAWAHLLFNVLGAAAVMLFLLLMPNIPWLRQPIDMWGISVVHTVFNLLSAAVFLPFTDSFARLIDYLSPPVSMVRSSQ